MKAVLKIQQPEHTDRRSAMCISTKQVKTMIKLQKVFLCQEQHLLVHHGAQSWLCLMGFYMI